MTIIAKWRHARGLAWVDLIDNGDGSFSYRAEGAAGFLGKMDVPSAVAAVEARLPALTPDAYKTPLARVKEGA